MTQGRSLRALGFVARLIPRRVALALYRVAPLARAVRALVNMTAPSGYHEVRVIHGPLAGCRLCLDLKLEKYLWLGTYEPWVQDALVRHLTPGMHAWDVGAYIGYHTLLMDRLLGSSRVVAMEPDAANRARGKRSEYHYLRWDVAACNGSCK